MAVCEGGAGHVCRQLDSGEVCNRNYRWVLGGDEITSRITPKPLFFVMDTLTDEVKEEFIRIYFFIVDCDACRKHCKL